MARRDSALDRARRRMAEDQRRVRADLASPRRSAGLSQDAVGAICGWSGSTQARIEAGAGTPAQMALVGADVGRDIRLQAFLAGDPIRDAGHARLLGRLRARLHASLAWATEVPLRIAGDLRAWDAVISGTRWRAMVDAETVLDDLQALDRRVSLKARDGRADIVLLVVADTIRNRRALRAAPGALSWLSRRSRPVLRALARGEAPPSGIVIL
jgi:hypothetical protein